MWVAEGHTKHDDRGPGTQQVQWWCDPLGDNGPCEVVCVNRGRRTHIGYPDGRGGLGGWGYDPLAFLDGFVLLR